MSTLSIIVSFYNSEKTIKMCVDSILTQTTKYKLEIIAVDDGSTDSSRAILESFKNSNINILSYGENRGLAFARNYGAKHAQSSLIAFIDSDMSLEDSWVDKGIKYMNSSDIVGIVGQYAPPPDVTKNSLDKYLYSNIRGARAHYRGQSSISFKYFLFSNTLIKKSVFEEVGGFNEEFTSYGGEDTDLSIRIYKLYPGGLYYCPDLISFHYGQKSLVEFCQNMHDFGKHNLSKIVEMYPEFENELQVFWLRSLLGYVVFNPIINKIVSLILGCYSAVYLLRYKIIYSTIEGYRERTNNQ